MSGLHAFRSRLGRLRFRRAWVRWQTAICRMLVRVVLGVVALLIVDFVLRLETVPRAVVMLVVGCVLVRQTLRRTIPPLARNETIVDVALLLERKNRVDSDLVAALQFDASANGSLGSPDLQQAVVERAAKISETLDFRSAVPKGDALRASAGAAIALLSISVGCLVFPDHASAFWNRLCLRNAKYPTRTRIDAIAVNGQTDEPRVIEGEQVTFQVQCSGVEPSEGVARLQGMETGDSTSVTLRRVDESRDVAIYVADGPPMSEPIEYSIQLGDADTESRRIALIQRPIVELTIEAVPPPYMQHEIIRQHEHYLQVHEGSAIEFSLRCTNRKQLKQVRFELIKVDEQAEELDVMSFAATDESRRTWHLDTHASRLTRISKDFQFRIVVVDDDGLGTFHPIEGAVRVKSDRAPTATLSSLQHAIMPNARPTIAYTAEDDFGVGSIVLHGRRAATREPDAEAQGTLSVELPFTDTLGSRRRINVRAEHVLDLSALQLAERDKVLVWVEVTDDRGEWPGVSALSEAIEFEVTDERGVLDSILRSDADAEQILTDVIEKELGLRGDR